MLCMPARKNRNSSTQSVKKQHRNGIWGHSWAEAKKRLAPSPWHESELTLLFFILCCSLLTCSAYWL